MWFRIALACFALGGMISTSPSPAADSATPASSTPSSEIRRAIVKYVTPAGESRVAPRFRLQDHEFSSEEQPAPEVSERIGISFVRFPSPVVTPVERNNTVHCEYYYPKREGKVPAVIVLHILGGDFPLARVFANCLAQHGVAALFLKMPYYGERRDPASPRRMISRDPYETREGLTQAILDIRQATAWLAARPEIDSEKLGIFGISLGGITGALAATAEPRLDNICLLLAGGDLARVAWESRELEAMREHWKSMGRTKQEFFQILAEVDPARYGANVRGRRILLLNASHDEVVPKACTEALWESFGKPDLVWFGGGHYTVAWHLLSALEKSSKFFQSSE